MTSRKERVWLEEYLKCWNATEAARRADYAWPRRMGSRKLQKFEAEIQARIDRLTMSADEVLVRLSEIASGAHGDYINGSGQVDLHRMVEDDKAHLIKKIRDTRHGKSIEFCDMQGALQLLGKHHRLFVERHEITGRDGGPVVVVDWNGDEDQDPGEPASGPGDGP